MFGSACSPPVVEIYPPQDDFCSEIGRSLTDRERIVKALSYAYEDDSLYHFKAFKAQILAQGRDTTREQVISRYLEAHPDCCGVFAPAYLEEKWAMMIVEGAAHNGVLDDWNRDVKIARRFENFGPLLEEKLGTNHWHHRMSACGEIKKIDRG